MSRTQILCITIFVLALAAPTSAKSIRSRIQAIRLLQKVNYDSDVNNFFQWMNKVRADPKLIIPELEATVKQFKGKLLGYKKTKEGASAYTELINFLKVQKPLSSMTWSNGMAAACQKFIDKAGPVGTLSHTGPDGSTLKTRINAEGNWKKNLGENLSYGSQDGKKSLIQLMVDDGTASRGHRKNIFSEKFNVVGIAIGVHKRYRFMTCNDFAGGFQSSQDANPKFTYTPATASSTAASPSSTKPATTTRTTGKTTPKTAGNSNESGVKNVSAKKKDNGIGAKKSGVLVKTFAALCILLGMTMIN
jgi:uncharacterized protein YkwD